MSTAILALLACAIFAWVLIAVAKKQRRAKSGSSVNLEGKGKFAIEAVGESHYQPALRACVTEDGYVEHDCEAHLVYEDDNQHDKNAIKVLIDGRLVGYLPRVAAIAYRQVMSEGGIDGATGIAKAKIFGGGRKKYGVWLDI